MKIKYLGPSDRVNVAPYGGHVKGQTKDYPDDFAADLLATSKTQRFEAVGGKKSTNLSANGGQNTDDKPAKKAKK